MIVLSLISILRVSNQQQQQQEHETSNKNIDNTNLRMPLCNDQQ